MASGTLAARSGMALSGIAGYRGERSTRLADGAGPRGQASCGLTGGQAQREALHVADQLG